MSSPVGKSRTGRIALDKFMVSKEGGLCILFINDTGADSVKGSVVQTSTSVDDAVSLAPVDADDTCGVIYNSGIPNGKEVWVVIAGVAQVLLENSTAATRGYWVKTGGTTAGRADATLSAPPGLVASHFQEIGHCLESVTAGTDKLARVMIHFN